MRAARPLDTQDIFHLGLAGVVLSLAGLAAVFAWTLTATSWVAL